MTNLERGTIIELCKQAAAEVERYFSSEHLEQLRTAKKTVATIERMITTEIIRVETKVLL